MNNLGKFSAFLFVFITSLGSFADFDLSNVEPDDYIDVNRLFTKPKPVENLKKDTVVIRKFLRKNESLPKGNLPIYAKMDRPKSAKGGTYQDIDTGFVANIYHPTLFKGAKLTATIIEDLEAVPGRRIPFTADILNGPYKGHRVFGQYTFYSEMKKIEGEINEMINLQTRDIYQVNGVVKSLTGTFGLKGHHVDNRRKGFIYSWMTKLVGGIVEHSADYKEFEENGYVKKPGYENAVKDASGKAIFQGAETMEKHVLTEPVYTEIRGPIDVQILVTERPTLLNKKEKGK